MNNIFVVKLCVLKFFFGVNVGFVGYVKVFNICEYVLVCGSFIVCVIVIDINCCISVVGEIYFFVRWREID